MLQLTGCHVQHNEDVFPPYPRNYSAGDGQITQPCGVNLFTNYQEYHRLVYTQSRKSCIALECRRDSF